MDLNTQGTNMTLTEFYQYSEEREKRLLHKRTYRRNRLTNETTEERMLRLRKDREYKQRMRMLETPEKKEERLRKDRERKQMIRALLTPERMQRHSDTSGEMTGMQTHFIHSGMDPTAVSDNSQGSEERCPIDSSLIEDLYERKQKRLEKDREYRRKRRQTDSTAVREEQLKRSREYKRKRRELESVEEREERLRKDRECKYLRRLFETPEQKRLINEKERERRNLRRLMKNKVFNEEIEVIYIKGAGAQMDTNSACNSSQFGVCQGVEFIKIEQEP